MSWEQLLSIIRTSREEAAENRARPPEACPNDGEPLRQDPVTGRLRCRFDGWEWDGEPVTW